MLEFKWPFPYYVNLKSLAMYENRPFIMSRQNCRTQVGCNKLSGLKIPFFSQIPSNHTFFIRKNKFSKSYETMYPFLEQFTWMDSIRRRLISQTCPNSVKKRMDELTLRVNLLRKRPGKSRRKMSDCLPHKMGTQSLWCLMCTWPSTFCVKAIKVRNYCSGDNVASDLLVCLLNIPLREHEKERLLLLKCMELCLPIHKRNGVFSFQN